MQHIQDKEFDEHFKDAFEDAELEPSAKVWTNIEARLSKKPRRVISVWWLAAALSVTTVAVGLLFYPSHKTSRPQVVYHHKFLPALKVKQQYPVDLQHQTIPRKQQAVPEQQTAFARVNHSLKAGIGNSGSLSDERAVPVADIKKILGAMQPSGLITHPVTKAVSVKQEKMTLPAISENTAGQDNLLAVADNGNADNGDKIINENDNTTASKGIRNIGDLVNYVVDKVDKREEKFLQFKTDDDNSSLIAINIGIIRFNSKKTHTSK